MNRPTQPDRTRRRESSRREFLRRSGGVALVAANACCFRPYVDEINFDSPPPVRADPEGRYPVPLPGEWTEL